MSATYEEAEFVLRTLDELIDYHEQADTERADEIADDLSKVFYIVRDLLPLNLFPADSPWVAEDERGAK